VPPVFDQAICVRHWEYSETSQTVWLFTRAHGLVRALAKGARRPQAPFAGGVELLTLANVGLILKPDALALLTEWDPVRLNTHLRRSLVAHRVGLHLADLVQHLLMEHDPHPDMFEAMLLALDRLRIPADALAAGVVFQVAALKSIGLWPAIDRFGDSPEPVPADSRWLAFDPYTHALSREAMIGGPAADRSWKVRPDTLALLNRIASDPASLEAFQAARQNPERTERAGRLLAHHIRSLVGRDPPTTPLVFPERRSRTGPSPASDPSAQPGRPGLSKNPR
jgi:DNA repair protein RecO